jgi:ABC-type lipoprotein release transport system permease subunit
MIGKIAFRNTFRQKRRTLLTALTMVGGFVLAAVSIGWSDGTYNTIINMFTRNELGHIQIHRKGYLDKPSLYRTIDNYIKVGKQITDIPGVESWTPRLFAAGLASVKDKSSAVQIRGIDPEREQKATQFDKKIIQGRSLSREPGHEAVLGKGLAQVLEADLSQEVVIVSQAADGSIANDLYTIIGILSSGDDASDRMSLYLHLTEAQELFVLPGDVHEIALVVEDLGQVDRITNKIKKALDDPDLEVSPWQEFAKSFYRAMLVDKEGMWVMIFVIILIVAVGVLNTVLMSVLERIREYGVQKAVGTRPGHIFWQVILEINFIAAGSILLGALLSFIFNHLISINGISLPLSFTYGGIEFKKMYAEVNLRTFIIPALTVILTALIVGVFPAFKAARVEPAKAMRMH